MCLEVLHYKEKYMIDDFSDLNDTNKRTGDDFRVDKAQTKV